MNLVHTMNGQLSYPSVEVAAQIHLDDHLCAAERTPTESIGAFSGNVALVASGGEVIE